jgi:hypothetical protein
LYGKVFLSIYDGTLYGHWEAIITMQQLIALADADGIVDMTPQAIAARTSIPFDIIERGIKKLSEADPYSRTPGEDGRRIILIDEHRPWGWQLVNYLKYKHLRDSDEVRAQTRERVRKHREKRNAGVTASNASNAEKRYTDTDTDKKKKNIPPPSGAFLRFWGSWPKHNRKQSQGKCWSVWLKADLDQQAEAILAHVEALKGSSDWRKESGKFIPAPLVYLNQGRWEGAEPPEPPHEHGTPGRLAI